ncbi:MAG: beta-ketoacyl-[acyl-carrier-protein] synthase family protein [Chromatiales bacterium]|nr:MAG: beta-ketoacyl-[acyl-carrier-protein] synthase family protein [Chromatiales bacterium]
MTRRVVITGLGTVTPFGAGSQQFWENIEAGQTAARLITQFDASTLPTRFVAQVPIGDAELNSAIKRKAVKTMSRATKMAFLAAREAVEDSGIEFDQLDPNRVGTSMGAGGLGSAELEQSLQSFAIVAACTNPGNMKVDAAKVWQRTLERVNPLTPLKALPNMMAGHIAIEYNARGACLTLASACISATQAIGEAYRYIKLGLADAMLAGGSDSMTNPNALVAFSALGVISRNNEEYLTAARPFDKTRDGFMLGEGGAVFVLEDYDNCKKRGAVPYAEIIGYANTCDAFRLTDEPAEAWGSIEAMRLALADAGIDASELDYINAHGTGTKLNDRTETFAIKSVMQQAPVPPISSTKSMIGHLVAAAGAVEAVASVQALEKQVIPPTINYQHPDPDCDLDYVPNEAREAQLRTVMSNSFGFGGQNASLIFRKTT